MSLTLVLIAIFVCVVATVCAIGFSISGGETTATESRLDALARGDSVGQYNETASQSVVTQSVAQKTPLEVFVSQYIDINTLLDQADAQVSPVKFIYICLGAAALGAGICIITPLPNALAPFLACGMAFLPYSYMGFKRKKRLQEFDKQLPDALELIGRALRAGHSLAAALHLAGDELAAPMGTEFRRVYEEQNLGVPLEDALDSMADRVPNLDFRFFVTSVSLQRQTGGDLAEILDKIGKLVRERFQIWGQVQALTGEGRLSGVVLLALPPLLFCVMYFLNPDYTSALWRKELGQKMLLGAIISQVVGAFVIKKVVDIKV